MSYYHLFQHYISTSTILTLLIVEINLLCKSALFIKFILGLRVGILMNDICSVKYNCINDMVNLPNKTGSLAMVPLSYLLSYLLF